MNVSENYNNLCPDHNIVAISKQYCLGILLFLVCVSCGAAEQIAATSSAINAFDYFKVLLGLVFVIGLFLLSTFLYRRYGNGPMTGRGQLRLIDGLHLGSRERLVLVEIKDKQILLSITPGQITKLQTMDVTPAVETD